VIDGGEPMEFRCLFKTWKEKDQTTGVRSNRRISGKKSQIKINALGNEFMAWKRKCYEHFFATLFPTSLVVAC
jgi:hypothetical protein